MAENLNYNELISLLYKADDSHYETLKQQIFEQFHTQVCLINIMTVDQSCYAITLNNKTQNVPYLSLYTSSHSDYEKLIGDPERMGLIDKQLSQQMIILWHEFCKTHHPKLNQYYHKDMYIGIEEAPHIFYTYLARKHKEDVSNILYTILKKALQNIYTSSYPSFEIVYNEDDYKAIEYMFDEATHHIITFINNEAMKLIPKYTIENPMVVHFWNPSMPNYNGYGLARQD